MSYPLTGFGGAVLLNTIPHRHLLFAAAFASILLATAWVGSVPTKDDFDPGVALTFLADGRLLAGIGAWILAAANVDGTLFGSRFLVWAVYAASCLVYISTVQRSLAPSQSGGPDGAGGERSLPRPGRRRRH